MLKYKDKKWYQFWQPEIQLSLTSAGRKKNFPFLFYWFHFRKVNIKRIVRHWIPFFPSTIMHCFTSVMWLELRSVAHTQSGVCGVCGYELAVWELSRSRVTDEETKGDVETWQGRFLDHSCIKLSYAKRFCAVVSAISVWPLWGRGNKSQVLKLK